MCQRPDDCSDRHRRHISRKWDTIDRCGLFISTAPGNGGGSILVPRNSSLLLLNAAFHADNSISAIEHGNCCEEARCRRAPGRPSCSANQIAHRPRSANRPTREKVGHRCCTRRAENTPCQHEGDFACIQRLQEQYVCAPSARVQTSSACAGGGAVCTSARKVQTDSPLVAHRTSPRQSPSRPRPRRERRRRRGVGGVIADRPRALVTSYLWNSCRYTLHLLCQCATAY